MTLLASFASWSHVRVNLLIENPPMSEVLCVIWQQAGFIQRGDDGSPAQIPHLRTSACRLSIAVRRATVVACAWWDTAGPLPRSKTTISQMRRVSWTTHRDTRRARSSVDALPSAVIFQIQIWIWVFSVSRSKQQRRMLFGHWMY